MKKLFIITRNDTALPFGKERKYAWNSPVWPLHYLKKEPSVKGLKVKVVDVEAETFKTIDALEFIGVYEDPRLKSDNLSLLLGKSRTRHYTMSEMQRLLKRDVLSEEQRYCVERYLELWLHNT